MPEGFELESPEKPGNINLGEAGNYRTDLTVARNHELTYTRSLVFGKNDNLYFPVDGYALLKHAFDVLYEYDQHTITLLSGGPAPR